MLANIFCKSVSCTAGAVLGLADEFEALLAEVVFVADVEGGAVAAGEACVSDLVALLTEIQVSRITQIHLQCRSTNIERKLNLLANQNNRKVIISLIKFA